MKGSGAGESPGMGVAQPGDGAEISSEWREQTLAELREEERLRLRKIAKETVAEEDHLLLLLEDTDILGALFMRIDAGNTGYTTRAAFLDFLETDADVRTTPRHVGVSVRTKVSPRPVTQVRALFKLDDNPDGSGGKPTRAQLEKKFHRFPIARISFPAFVALLRTVCRLHLSTCERAQLDTT